MSEQEAKNWSSIPHNAYGYRNIFYHALLQCGFPIIIAWKEEDYMGLLPVKVKNRAVNGEKIHDLQRELSRYGYTKLVELVSGAGETRYHTTTLRECLQIAVSQYFRIQLESFDITEICLTAADNNSNAPSFFDCIFLALNSEGLHPTLSQTSLPKEIEIVESGVALPLRTFAECFMTAYERSHEQLRVGAQLYDALSRLGISPITPDQLRDILAIAIKDILEKNPDFRPIQ